MRTTRIAAGVTGLVQGAQPTPEWPQVWIGTPDSEETGGAAWAYMRYDVAPSVYIRWSEDGEIWLNDSRFEDPIDVLSVPAGAIQVSGVID